MEYLTWRTPSDRPSMRADLKNCLTLIVTVISLSSGLLFICWHSINLLIIVITFWHSLLLRLSDQT